MFRTKPCFALGRLLSLAPSDGVREPNRDIVSQPDRIVSQPGAALQRNWEAAGKGPQIRWSGAGWSWGVGRVYKQYLSVSSLLNEVARLAAADRCLATLPPFVCSTLFRRPPQHNGIAGETNHLTKQRETFIFELGEGRKRQKREK